LPRSVSRELAASPNRSEILSECRAILAAEAPANEREFATVIERLWLHYPESKLSPAEQRLVVQDWRRLLGHLPPDILQAAADAYVMSPARFAPTPGQLYALAEKLWGYRQRLAARAKETLSMIQQQVAQ
jgi:hypothetical protein